MCRRSARSSGQWDRSAYSSEVRGVVGSKDEGNTQRNAKTQKKQVYRISVKKRQSVRSICICKIHPVRP
jgi:hypothetical protein